MKISSKQLIGLSVETESGQVLGTLEDFNLDIDSQSVLEYVVKPSNLVKDLIFKNLIISRGQVVEITDQKIVVEDSVVGVHCEQKKNELKKNAPQGAMMSE